MVRELEDRKIGLEDAELAEKIDDAIFAVNDVLRVFSLEHIPRRLHPKNFEALSKVNEAINKRNKK